MENLTPILITLSILWFVVYWILGGVFFAAMALLRLGRVRKVRFSCLFTLLAMACAIGAAFGGLRYSRDSVNQCLLEAENKAESITAIFGCGFVTIFGALLLGAAVLVIGGFLIMIISKSKTKPWINLNGEEEGATESKGGYFN